MLFGLSARITSFLALSTCIIENLINLIDRADCEKGVELYYEGSNKDQLIENLLAMEAFEEIGNFGTIDIETAINTVLQAAGAENWETNPHFNQNENNCLYRIWDFDSRVLINNFPDVLKEVAEKILSTNEKCLLLNIEKSFHFHREFIPIFKDCRNSQVNQLPKFVHIQFVMDLQQLENWFLGNRLSRNLNISDMRHQENSPQYIPKKSPLLYDLRNPENHKKLQKLLTSALGDQRTSKDLVNYDSEKDCYIWFEYENDNPQNQYHCYHLVKPQTHEIDTTAEAKIPERIIRILNLLKD